MEDLIFLAVHITDSFRNIEKTMPFCLLITWESDSKYMVFSLPAQGKVWELLDYRFFLSNKEVSYLVMYIDPPDSDKKDWNYHRNPKHNF